MENDYKVKKEAFVTGMTGSTVMHVNLVSLAALVRMLSICILNRLTVNRHQ